VLEITTRYVNERPEGVRAGSARLVGTDGDGIVTETFLLLDDPGPLFGTERVMLDG
jgi:UDP-N-acetylglucosamine 2-epimerase